ncbi:MAG: LTA synthase family protein, partial [Mucilaginibacter sp.]
MGFTSRLAEYKALLYRLLLAYLFYFISRVLFFAYNTNLFAVDDTFTLLKLCWYGLAFDTTALLYINSLFIILSILPLKINTQPKFQKGLTILYFVSNLLFYATNFVDIIYYRFSQVRSTRATLDLLYDESNKKALFEHFTWEYWYVIFIYLVCCAIWIWLYRRVKVKPVTIKSSTAHFAGSAIVFLVVIVLMIGGIRGDFKHSTRPINMVDAYKHVVIP